MRKIYFGVFSLIAILFLLHPFAGKSQTGIFYFANISKKYNNSRIVNMCEANNKELYLIGKANNENFTSTIPFFARMDKRGNLLLQKNLEANDLFNIKELVILPNQHIQIYGSEKSNDKYIPYIRTISASGDIKNLDTDFSIYSTIINDIEVVDESNILVTETKLGKQEKYNVNIYKYNISTNKQVWYKKISSEVNEEADQILFLKNQDIIILGKKYNNNMTSYVPIIYKLNSKGEKIWKKGISVPENFYTHSIAANKNGKLFYTCNYSRESTGANETRIITIAPTNEILQYKTLLDISANGIISLKNDNFLIYGSNLIVKNSHVITKANYIIIDQELNIVKKYEMSDTDIPDKDFPNNSLLSTSSDLLTAIQLSDGRIACGGRIYMPKNTSPDIIKNSPKQNNSYIIILDAEGNF